MTAPQRLGWIAPEIEIAQLLEAGYAELAPILADDDQAAAFLRRVFWNSTDEQRAQYRRFLASGRAIPIFENYPRAEQNFPCHAIILSGGENKEFVGLVGDTQEATVDTPGGPVSAEAWTESIGVLTRAEKPSELFVLHQLAKFFIARRRVELADVFEINIAMAQRDLGFVRELLPAFVYDRLLQVTVSFLQLNAADIPSTAILDFATHPDGRYART